MSKHNYKVGQTVRLKSWEEIMNICEEEEYTGDLVHQDGLGTAYLTNKWRYGSEAQVLSLSKRFEMIQLSGSNGISCYFYPWEIEPIEEKKVKIEPCVVHTPKEEQWEDVTTFLAGKCKYSYPDHMEWVVVRDGLAAHTYEQFKKKYIVADLEKFKESGTKAWAGKNAQEWIDEIRGRKPEVDRIPDTKKTIKPKRTWEVNTEVRSSDGITVSEDYVLIKDDEGNIVWEGGEVESRDLMNKLRKGLDQHKKHFRDKAKIPSWEEPKKRFRRKCEAELGDKVVEFSMYYDREEDYRKIEEHLFQGLDVDIS